MQPRHSPFRYAVLLAIALFASLPVFATQSFTLAWTASADTNVVGYYVYYGPTAGNYTNRLDAGTNLSIVTPQLPPGNYYFSATSRNAAGVESSFANVVNTNVAAPDTTPPIASTTWPKVNTSIPNGQKCVNGTLITVAPDVPMSGAVTDNGVVANVTVTRVVPSWAPLTFAPTLVGPNGSKAWTNIVTLVDGTNTFRIVATDSAGLTSTVVRTIFLRTIAAVSVTTNGYGTTAPTGVLTFGSARDGALLQIGRSYSIKATPQTGNWFVNWTDGTGAVLGTNAILTFQMTNGLSLTANFVTNAITAYHLAGSYNGLFAEESAVATRSAGSVTSVTVASTRAFTGKLFVAGASYSFSGSFDPSGFVTKTIPRSLKPSLLLSLQMDFARGTQQIVGSVACPAENWTSPLRANLAYYGATTPNPLAGRYTMAIPPSSSTGGADAPIGYGYGLITNSPAGLVTLTGALADLASISCNGPLAQSGDWPVFVDLYAHQGLLYGWLNFSSGAPVGRLSWVKPPQPPATNMLSKMFPAGVDNSIQVIGSIYRSSTPAVALASDSIELNLSTTGAATYPVAVTNNNTLISSAHITGTVATATGLVTINLPSTIAGGVARTGYGVVLQNSKAALGTVSGTNAAIYLH